MAIVKCFSGHYYDDQKNEECPYCNKDTTFPDERGGIGEQATSYYGAFDDDDGQLTEAYCDNVDEEQRTIGVFLEENLSAPTAGWLVCINGPVKGMSYTLRSGRNFAGRSADMDIILYDDPKLSRRCHFSVVYDPKSVEFYLVAGEGCTYHNGVAVTSQVKLIEGDEIAAGDSNYVFVPYCKEGRVW